MTDDEWAKSLKPGDEIAVGNYHRKDIRTVDRVTATQVVVGDARFRRKDGMLVGDYHGLSRPYIMPATQKIRDGVRREKLEAEIRRFADRLGRRDAVPLDILEAVAEAIRTSIESDVT